MAYNFFRVFLACSFLFLLSNSSFGQVKNRLELGIGGMKSTEYIDLLVKVSSKATFGEETDQDGETYIIVKVNADAAFDTKSLTYLDFSFEVAPSIDVYDDGDSRLYLGYNLISFKAEKNIDLDQAYQYQLSVVGFRVGGQKTLGSDKLKLFGQISLDLVSVLFDSKRYSDGVALSSKEYGSRASSGINAFLGLELKNKFKIVFGAEFMETSALGHEELDGTVHCTEYYDDFGYYLYTECFDGKATVYDENWSSSKVYADATVNITKSLSVFGRASYNVFKMSDATEYFPSSKNKQWQFMLGVKYNLFSASKR